jgi:NADH-quinone oxidoreductase subunit H
MVFLEIIQGSLLIADLFMSYPGYSHEEFQIYFVEFFTECFGLIILILVGVALFTLFERKILSSIQRRIGPNVVGFQGFLQPLLDGLKLAVKEGLIPTLPEALIYIIAPLSAFFFSLISWILLPFTQKTSVASLELSIIFIFALSGLSTLSIMLAGWSGNSKYAFFGAIRSSAQILSYEVSIGLILLPIILYAQSFNLHVITSQQYDKWLGFALWPTFLLYCVSMLAETNRHPFDLPEAEAELIAGYNVEYSGLLFALFFLAEYSHMLFQSVLCCSLFLGISTSLSLGCKALFFMIFFINTRAILPRYRYDQLMRLGWKVFLPLALGFCILTAAFLNIC